MFGYKMKDIIIKIIEQAPAIITALTACLAAVAAAIAANRSQKALVKSTESKQVSLGNNTKLANLLQIANGEEKNTRRAAEIEAGTVPGDRATDTPKIDN